MSIRTGRPNAGHTVEHNGSFCKVQSVPCAFSNPQCLLAIGAGGIIDLEILRREIEECELEPDRLVVDPQAVVIREEHVKSETLLRERIGSTGKGVVAAVAAKVLRSSGVRLARDIDELQDYLGDVSQLASDIVDPGGNVSLEGTQGFGLSLHHGFYPFVTSRDTTAGVLCSEAGVSPRLVEDIIMVIRTYPIRVAGNSGPLNEEIDWQTVTEESGAPCDLVERTTGANMVRRVGRFDLQLVKRAVTINRPTRLALNFVDYIDSSNRGKQALEQLTSETQQFIDMIEEETGVPVTIIGTGPRQAEIIDVRHTPKGHKLPGP